jgi:hypothetical protein
MQQLKPFLYFEPIQPLPILERKIKQLFLNKTVVVRYGNYETFCFGKLIHFEINAGKTILILENFNKKMIVQNPSLIKVI